MPHIVSTTSLSIRKSSSLIEKLFIFVYCEKCTKHKHKGMAHICITTSEKSENEQVKNKIHAHLLFLTVKGLSIQNLCLKDKMLISFITVRLLKD